MCVYGLGELCTWYELMENSQFPGQLMSETNKKGCKLKLINSCCLKTFLWGNTVRHRLHWHLLCPRYPWLHLSLVRNKNEKIDFKNIDISISVLVQWTEMREQLTVEQILISTKIYVKKLFNKTAEPKTCGIQLKILNLMISDNLPQPMFFLIV